MRVIIFATSNRQSFILFELGLKDVFLIALKKFPLTWLKAKGKRCCSILGNYGKIYHRLDQSIIFDFIKQYEEEKAIYLEHERLDQKTEEASNVLDLMDHLPQPLKQKFLNMLRKGLLIGLQKEYH